MRELKGATAPPERAERGVLTISLAHCAEFIAERLREARDILAGAQFKDPVLGLFALQGKIAGQIRAASAS